MRWSSGAGWQRLLCGLLPWERKVGTKMEGHRPSPFLSEQADSREQGAGDGEVPALARPSWGHSASSGATLTTWPLKHAPGSLHAPPPPATAGAPSWPKAHAPRVLGAFPSSQATFPEKHPSSAQQAPGWAGALNLGNRGGLITEAARRGGRGGRWPREAWGRSENGSRRREAASGNESRGVDRGYHVAALFWAPRIRCFSKLHFA